MVLLLIWLIFLPSMVLSGYTIENYNSNGRNKYQPNGRNGTQWEDGGTERRCVRCDTYDNNPPSRYRGRYDYRNRYYRDEEPDYRYYNDDPLPSPQYHYRERDRYYPERGFGYDNRGYDYHYRPQWDEPPPRDRYYDRNWAEGQRYYPRNEYRTTNYLFGRPIDNPTTDKNTAINAENSTQDNNTKG